MAECGRNFVFQNWCEDMFEVGLAGWCQAECERGCRGLEQIRKENGAQNFIKWLLKHVSCIMPQLSIPQG